MAGNPGPGFQEIMNGQPSPPQWVDRLLGRLCNRQLLESMEGDLYELFLEDLEKKGIGYARRKYALHALAFLRYRSFLRKNTSKTYNNMALIGNYLKISLRDLRRHSTFSFINISGLITGFVSILFILQFVLFEYGFDRFHPDGENIYRIINARYQHGELVQKGAITYPVIGPTLNKEFPEVAGYTRLTVGGRTFLEVRDELFMVDEYLWADENFLDMFNFPLLYGNPETALSEPSGMVVTRRYAERLLAGGQQLSDLVGMQVKVNNWDFPVMITGVAEDVPVRSHLQFDVLISYNTFIRLAGEGADNSWEWSDFYHYIRLEDQADVTAFEAKLDEFGRTYFKDGEVSGAVERFSLQPLAEIHLDTDQQYEYARVTDGGFVRLILLIGIMILLIAWVNYINITTSRALQRAREVGIRKVMGAYRRQLVGQFLTEALLVNLLALTLAFCLVFILQPVFNELVSLPLGLSLLLEASAGGIPFLVYCMLAFLAAIMVIGYYPAILTSRFSILEVVKGKIGRFGDMLQLRRVLVVGQFAAALILISGSLAIYRQIDFMRNQDLGLDLENNLVIHGPQLRGFDSTFIEDFSEFRNALSSYSGIESVTATRHIPGDRLPKSFQIHSPMDPERLDIGCNWMAVDHDFFTHFKIPLVAGRYFGWQDHHTNGDDVNTVMLNESALPLFGFESAQQAVGEVLEIEGRAQPYFKIVGVVENFHQQSLKKTIDPLMFLPYYSNSQFMVVKYGEGREDQAISLSREVFSRFYPGNYFDYYFLEDFFNRQYREDMRIGLLSAVFTVIAIILAGMGLYGLVLLTLMKKTKEIGVRKVLGADLPSLLSQVGRSFMMLIGIALLIGIPVSYWGIRRFLSDYPYTRGVEIPVLLIAAGSLLVLCLVTILFQTKRITANNPVETLKAE